MKVFKKIIKYLAIVIAFLIALTYALGYDYLFKGIAKTYLRGEASATIDDGELFPQNIILAEKPEAWILDSLYNKKKLPANLVSELKESQTVSFLVIKNGKLLHEEYWDGYNKNSVTNSFSMAKTVTSLLLGAAIDDGRIKSENQFFSDFYPEFSPTEYGKFLTLKNLITMESGLDWDEKYHNPFSPNAKAYYGNHLFDAVMNQKIVKMPGKSYVYQSGNTQLLGFAIKKAVNMPLASFASKKLWNPLGMEQNAYWSTDENKMEKSFCCIHSNSRDFAKLGQLILEEGKVDSLQIIPQDYIKKMITPTKESNYSYGYGIWINPNFEYPYYYFRGILGQYIVIVPNEKLVLVRTGNNESIEVTKDNHPVLINKMIKSIVENY